jgi:hypothetical protein
VSMRGSAEQAASEMMDELTEMASAVLPQATVTFQSENLQGGQASSRRIAAQQLHLK